MAERERSLWGWGYTDRFPDAKRLKALAEQVGGLLEADTPTPESPRPLDPDRLCPSRFEVPSQLARVLQTDALARARHTYGRAYRDLVRGFAGDFVGAPDAVAFARSEEDVERVLEWCTTQRIAVVPFGGGTSVVGGVEAAVPTGYRGVVSLDLRGLNRLLELDDVSRGARLQAGATGPELEGALGAHGFTLRHYPQSFEFSTLGGWIATRAGGHFATLYTHIDDLVESTRTVTCRGVLESRRLPASGAGPNPDRLILGSEGTLGVITEAWVRVQPRPKWKVGASVHFEEFDRAVEAARAMSQSGLYPTNCRLLDAAEAFLNGAAFDGSSVLLLAFESADHPVEAWMARALELAVAHGGTCPRGLVDRMREESTDAAASWRAAFLDAPYLQSAMVSLGVIADTFETACTWRAFPALHERVTAAVRDCLVRVAGGGVVTCRFTHVYPDGPAPYYTFLCRGRRGAELEQWAEIKAAASAALLEAGGTTTHHHAVGRVHRPWYDRERPAPFADALAAAKAALDPAWILNPGVLIDPPAALGGRTP